MKMKNVYLSVKIFGNFLKSLLLLKENGVKSKTIGFYG